MTRIVFESSEDGINKLPEIMERFHTILLNSQNDYDVNISISVSKINSKYNKNTSNNLLTSSSVTPPTDIRLQKKRGEKYNETTQATGTSSVVQQTSGGYVDLAKLRAGQSQNFEKISKSLISNRPHRR
ncbi:Hypothetical protein SRAE_2000203700 [Strongyloides ratti]|uniref:Uncharacterized protein n=1 Tax=Strongyloides ratti TaxID=34506 RepID=A0A090LGW6_STRRB|nr:Hypothetical protein SRAE_2000203700 [Strongyloides ratti]CEF67373.1 Hypothetical protein SRAE_2000203700 [Strongyloides ratti]